MSDDLLVRADAHMKKFSHHDLVAKLAARVRELEAALRAIAADEEFDGAHGAPVCGHPKIAMEAL